MKCAFRRRSRRFALSLVTLHSDGSSVRLTLHGLFGWHYWYWQVPGPIHIAGASTSTPTCFTALGQVHIGEARFRTACSHVTAHSSGGMGCHLGSLSGGLIPRTYSDDSCGRCRFVFGRPHLSSCTYIVLLAMVSTPCGMYYRASQ